MTKEEFENQISELQSRISYLERQIELKDIEIKRLKNRGAGRTPVFSEREKEKIVADYNTGKTIRETAKLNHCSVGFVHKLIIEHSDQDQHD